MTLKQLIATQTQASITEPIIREFKPAAIALEESPPSYIARSVLWSVMAFFVITIVWATIGQVDIVSIADGKLIPKGRTNIVQPEHMGRVAYIHIKDGDRVQAGQMLITIDGTETRAELNRLLETKQLTERRLLRQNLWIDLLQKRLANKLVPIQK